jgi:hypothetical protein
MRVVLGRCQQPSLAVVPEHPGRDLAQARELADSQHGASIDRGSRRVRVKFPAAEGASHGRHGTRHGPFRQGILRPFAGPDRGCPSSSPLPAQQPVGAAARTWRQTASSSSATTRPDASNPQTAVKLTNTNRRPPSPSAVKTHERSHVIAHGAVPFPGGATAGGRSPAARSRSIRLARRSSWAFQKRRWVAAHASTASRPAGSTE